MSRSSRAPNAANRGTRSLITLTTAILALLSLQFLFGMLTNLFVAIPKEHPGAQAPHYFAGVIRGVGWALASSRLLLAAHVATGMVLELLAIALVVVAARSRQRLWIWVALVGWLGVTGAGFNGASFINYGHDFSSMIMAACFLLAAIAYDLALHLGR